MIEIGDYIRLKNGDIGKYFIRQFINYIDINDNLWGIDIENDIVKHSKNIIDLIEVGDYVNGEKVEKINEPSLANDYNRLIFCNEREGEYNLLLNREIKNVVTKEQFKNIEYRLED